MTVRRNDLIKQDCQNYIITIVSIIPKGNQI